MNSILRLQSTIFLLIFAGYVVKRAHLVHDQGHKNLTDLVIYLILPCNILQAFATGADREKLGTYLSIFLIALALQVFCLIYGKILFGRYAEGKRKCLQYATICSNAGFIGNPLVEGIWGMEGLAMASVYLIPLRVMMWSNGLAVFSGETNRKAVFKKVMTHPCILACMLGIILLLTGWRLPEVILAPVKSIGQCNTAMSMLVIGMILERMELRSFLDRDALLFSVHRLILLPGIVYLVLRLLPLDDMVVKISTLLMAMPAGATTSILAEKYRMEPEFATKIVIVSTLLSLPTIFCFTCLLA